MDTRTDTAIAGGVRRTDQGLSPKTHLSSQRLLKLAEAPCLLYIHIYTSMYFFIYTYLYIHIFVFTDTHTGMDTRTDTAMAGGAGRTGPRSLSLRMRKILRIQAEISSCTSILGDI